MAPRYDTISFLSDYGTVDEFVGVVKSVIRSISPHVSVIDLSHEIGPHDVRSGGLALARAVQYVAPGVILGVVDPGVGTDRRAVAVEVEGGEAVFVGPDNGLLAPAVSMAGGATRAVELTDTAFHLQAPGRTFAGRDVFAPVAAHLCNGAALLDLGEALDPVELLPAVLPVSEYEGEVLAAEVLWVDRFGNLQLNVDPDQISDLGDRVTLAFEGGPRGARLAGTYGAIRPGEVGLVVDAYGLLSVCLDRHSAAEELGLDVGDAVRLAAPSDSAPNGAGPTSSPVQLGPRRGQDGRA